MVDNGSHNFRADNGGDRHLGSYSLIREIGRGSTSTVYEAIDQRNGRVVALKALVSSAHLSNEDQAALLSRTAREARAIENISHPNVVRIVEVGSAGSTPETCTPYLVMELLSGETLRQRLDRSGALTPALAARILEQAADALDAVHAAGIVHRDIKPGNLIIGTDGVVKLMDFGIARRAEDTVVTRAGMMVGSPTYMSPEQAQGNPANDASDLWALSVVLYEMLAGHPPYRGENIPALLHEILYGSPMPLPASVPAKVQAVVSRALARDPVDRYPTGRSLSNALHAVVETVAVAAAAVVPQFHGGQAARVSTAAPMAATAPLAAAAPVTPATTTPELRRRRPAVLPAWAIPALMVSLLFIAVFLATRPAHRRAAPGSTVTATRTIARQPTPDTLSVRRSPLSPNETAAVSPSHQAIVARRAGETITPDRSRTTPPAILEKPQMQPASLPRIVEVTPVAGIPRVVPSALTITPHLVTPANSRHLKVTHPPVQVALAQVTSHEFPGHELPVVSDPTPTPAAILPTSAPPTTPAPAAPVPATTPAPPVRATPQPAPHVAATRPAPVRIAAPASTPLSGTWRGTYSYNPAVLSIDSTAPDTGSFVGSLSVKTEGGTFVVAVTGRLANDGTVSFQEQRVTSAPEDADWTLGAGNGSVNSSGRMQGNGKDAHGFAYPWSFQR